ncbi:MAG: NapC/NirT family cytochrome c [Chitinivibrionales bacterium]|nr:NapC/NirT family cytochrome c [Chitinivibrionales bacterium]
MAKYFNIIKKIFSNKKRLVIIISGVLLLFLGLGFGMIEITAQPRFCTLCHYMDPYYKQWKRSSHNKVACVKCHYPPGFKNVIKAKLQAVKQVVAYVTKSYSTRAYAEIEDASCLRKGCHEKRLLDTTVTFKENIKFNHKHHLMEMRRGKKLRCTSCHSQMVFGEHITVTENVCFLCHFKDRVDGIHPMGQAFCTTCHPSPAKDIVIGDVTYNHKEFVDRGVPCQNCHLEVVQGTGKVAKSNCYACHAEQDRLQHFNDGELMHLNHVTRHKVACNRCHEEITHSVKTTNKPLDYSCNICHSFTHNATKDLYMGKGGKGVAEKPSHMFKVHVDCIGCHVSNEFPPEVARFKGQTFRPSEAGCLKCHGKDVEGMLENWKSSINEELQKTSALLAKADAKLKEGSLDAAGKKLLADAQYNYDFVKYAKGVHNIDYALDLLTWSDAALKKVIEGKE